MAAKYVSTDAKFLKFISRYAIYRDGIAIEWNLPNWRTALAHARKWQYDLFDNPRKIEIMNIWTGEIIDIKEAEKRAAAYTAKRA